MTEYCVYDLDVFTGLDVQYSSMKLEHTFEPEHEQIHAHEHDLTCPSISPKEREYLSRKSSCELKRNLLSIEFNNLQKRKENDLEKIAVHFDLHGQNRGHMQHVIRMFKLTYKNSYYTYLHNEYNKAKLEAEKYNVGTDTYIEYTRICSEIRAKDLRYKLSIVNNGMANLDYITKKSGLSNFKSHKEILGKAFVLLESIYYPTPELIEMFQYETQKDLVLKPFNEIYKQILSKCNFSEYCLFIRMFHCLLYKVI
jgi:hypothetical protein